MMSEAVLNCRHPQRDDPPLTPSSSSSTAKRDLDECNRDGARIEGKTLNTLMRWRQTTTAATTMQVSSGRYRHGVPAVASNVVAKDFACYPLPAHVTNLIYQSIVRLKEILS